MRKNNFGSYDWSARSDYKCSSGVRCSNSTIFPDVQHMSGVSLLNFNIIILYVCVKFDKLFYI
jgi:hypothetical protein